MIELSRKSGKIGAWRSLVAHCVRDAGVGGSNPLAPIIKPGKEFALFLACFLKNVGADSDRQIFGKGDYVPIIFVGATPAVSLFTGLCILSDNTALRKFILPDKTPKTIDINQNFIYDIFRNGAVAQQGERLHGMQEVVGSIPSSSIFVL